MKIKVYQSKGSHDLWERWKALSRYPDDLAAIVQNPMPIDGMQLEHWRSEVSQFMMAIRELERDTFDFITTQRTEMVEEQV